MSLDMFFFSIMCQILFRAFRTLRSRCPPEKTLKSDNFRDQLNMPKTKKQASESGSSDSDEGPVDRNPPPAKKSKGASGARTDDKEPTWVLQGNKLVKVREFKGKLYVDIREFYEKGGELLPGKKGISLPVELWRKLLTLTDEINEVITSM